MNYQEIQDKISNIDWSSDHGIVTDLMTKLIFFHGEGHGICDENCNCKYCSLVKRYKQFKKQSKKINNLIWEANDHNNYTEQFKDNYYSIDYYEELYENICFMMKGVEDQQIDMKTAAINKIKL